MGDEHEMAPYRRLAFAALNLALRDTRGGSYQGEARRFLSRTRDREVLVVLCGLVGESPKALSEECAHEQLPWRLPRWRKKRRPRRVGVPASRKRSE